MSNGTAGTAAVEPKKSRTEITEVSMKDGRKVGFAGKRKMVKETLIDETKVLVDGNTVTLEEGAVKVRMNFRNGHTITFSPPVALVAKAVGHGIEQKLGDE